MNQESFLVFVYNLGKFFKREDQVTYYDTLSCIHQVLKPAKYIEVGIRHGRSLKLAQPGTVCYGIDPEPNIQYDLTANTKVFNMTSDEFFADYSKYDIDGKPVNLAFIDGMHLFEFVLRDFINIEKLSDKKGIILLHDTIPIDKITAARERTTDIWTGDVYKIILILKKYRPDLKIYNLDAAPSGLAIVKNLNPSSTVLQDNYDKIVEEFMSYDYDLLEKNKILSIKPNKKYKKFLIN